MKKDSIFWFVLVSIFMVSATIIRFLNAAHPSDWASFTPLGAMALFGGVHFSNRWLAIAFPLSSLLISDLLINIIVFKGEYGIMYAGWEWTYFSFSFIVWLGRYMLKQVQVSKILVASLFATIVYTLIIDFSVWFRGGIDIRTGLSLSYDIQGLIQCYIQGLPFARNFLFSTLVYSSIMFGLFESLITAFPYALKFVKKSLVFHSKY